MPTIDEKRKAVLEQAIRDMGNYGIKLRKPEELPDFDQPIDYEEEKKRFEPIQVEDMEERDSHEEISQTSYQEIELSSTDRTVFAEETHRREGKSIVRERLAEFQRKYLQPLRVSHRKAVYGLSTSFLILARCVFVRQTAVCPTKSLAPKGIKSLQSRD